MLHVWWGKVNVLDTYSCLVHTLNEIMKFSFLFGRKIFTFVNLYVVASCLVEFINVRNYVTVATASDAFKQVRNYSIPKRCKLLYCTE